ncbi:hypothetical protein GCM10010503_45040 [Streptomyces lucensis JCM 4490]|uniref:HTH luxR-type domain-containing protein n=1 Tax=Streptomyces lucensis JCM 4490 TaxID=1306176 RepID=A0A918MTI7_9ACTN|nr:helix-turn-helix transcriptional regulator [Streptomyces lucensis]GGW62718.1 hypothetical protein GCM10010503_45040 [Streptomyces lucensis JCM 4490]
MSHREHGAEELCAAGKRLYQRALRDGYLPAAETAEAPCLTGLGLLHPAVDDLGRLEPVAPAAALNRFLRSSRARVDAERRREDRLLELFEPLLHAGTPHGAPADAPTLRLLSGTESINHAIGEALAEAAEEVLCVQPHAGLTGPRGEAAYAAASARDQALLDRGVRLRALYQHTLRHLPSVYGSLERLRGDFAIRGLDELPDRQIIVDRTAAFIPAGDDRRLALEVRHPALLGFFVTAFDRLWRLATPLYPQAVQRPSVGGVTPRQRAIAALLVEGHTDAVIAERLGMNVRTARLHIAKLATVLGSTSRAQLGHLIGRSGLLGPER